MQHLLPLTILALASLCPLSTSAAADDSASAPSARQPNVILFLIDDLGWSDLGITGSTFYETPHLDQLAREGAFFTDAYAANPVCSPTRASVLTGQYPSRIKLTNHSGSKGATGPNYKLNPPEVAGNIPLSQTTLAEALKQAGYLTAHIGKWHLQTHSEKGRSHYPEANGFDLNIAGHKMGQPGSYYFPYQSDQHPSTNVPDLGDGKQGDYLTDVLTDKAISFIKQNKDKAFFLNLWYYTVHTPIIPDKSKIAKYQAKLAQMDPALKKAQGIPVYQSTSRPVQSNVSYACMVESMDQNIGRILKQLKALDLEDDTLVIFLSDNGGLSTGTGPNAPTSCLPLRAGKAWVYEGGIRSPLIIKLPGKIKAAQKISEPACSTDLYPTILDLAGLPLRPTQHLDGVSLTPLLTGQKTSLDREALYFHYPHYHHINTMGPAGAIRMGDYKLIEVFETGKVELYNLRDDLGEHHDLSQKKPKLTQKLTQKLHQWQKASGALLPTRRPAGGGRVKSEE